MDNRFKFRAWDKTQNKMYHDVEMTYDYPCEPRGAEASSFGCVLMDDDYIVMQCTGLKDKNGKLIYEGDIVNEMDFTYHKVVWEAEYCRYLMISLNGNYLLDSTLESTTDGMSNHRIEVIGNIYEDEDLLND